MNQLAYRAFIPNSVLLPQSLFLKGIEGRQNQFHDAYAIDCCRTYHCGNPHIKRYRKRHNCIIYGICYGCGGKTRTYVLLRYPIFSAAIETALKI